MSEVSLVLFSVGHSNLPATAFAGMLRRHRIDTLVDVRSMPGSRYCPQFNQDAMASWLPNAGIDYRHLPKLGGRRRGPMSGENAGWKNASFRRYADYTSTDDFEAGFDELLGLAAGRRVAFMCSEAVPWRCHRLLISNVLVARGHQVTHIEQHGTRTHELGLFGAQPQLTCDEPPCVIYPDGASTQLSLSEVVA